MITIAHVLSSFALGGQERMAVDLAATQVKAGHRVHAISLAPPPDGVLARDFAERGVTVHTVPKGSGVDPTLVYRLRETFRRAGVQVVHTHNPQPLFYGALAGRLAGAVVVHTKHGANPDAGRRLWLRRFGGHLVHAYVAVSEATARVARKNHECPPARLHTVTNGIVLDRFAPDPASREAIRAELAIPDDAFVFGTVGRVSKEKDHVHLLRSVGPLLGPKVRLVIVGDGDEMPKVRAEAEHLNPWVSLMGLRRDVERILPAFDVFVLSSRSEGLPLALVEAMASGLPLVCTDVGGVKDVVEDAGLIVPARDEGALRAAMRTLLESPERLEHLRALAPVRARRYDARRMSEDYLALYRAALG